VTRNDGNESQIDLEMVDCAPEESYFDDELDLPSGDDDADEDLDDALQAGLQRLLAAGGEIGAQLDGKEEGPIDGIGESLSCQAPGAVGEFEPASESGHDDSDGEINVQDPDAGSAASTEPPDLDTEIPEQSEEVEMRTDAADIPQEELEDFFPRDEHAMALPVSADTSPVTSAAAPPTSQHAQSIDNRAGKLRQLLAGGVCNELGITYNILVKQLRERAANTKPAARTPVSFKVKSTPAVKPVSVPRHAASVASTHKVAPKAGPLAPVVVVDEDESVADKGNSSVNDKTDGAAEQMPPELEEAYACRTAPLALLRAYCAHDKQVYSIKGFIFFEDDGVEYPASTLMPLRDVEDSGSLLSLASVWLLAALRGKYVERATPELCQKHGATRISSVHVASLLDFLSGKREDSELLLVQSALSQVQPPVPKFTVRPQDAASRRPLVSTAQIRSLPGSEVPLGEKGASDRLERLRRQLAEEAEGAAAAQELAESVKEVALVEVAIERVESEERALIRLVANLRSQLVKVDQEVADAIQHRQKLHDDFCALSAVSGKRRRVSDGQPTWENDALARLLVPLDGGILRSSSQSVLRTE